MSGTSGPTDPRPPEPAPEPVPTAVEMIRSEEQFRIGRTARVSGRAVLRKYVVTETVTQTFQVRHEEVRLDLEPIDGTNGTDGTGRPVELGAVPFEGRVVEVVLHREVPVVQLQVQATELVRLHVDTVTEQVPVSADLRAEHVEIETPAI